MNTHTEPGAWHNLPQPSQQTKRLGMAPAFTTVKSTFISGGVQCAATLRVPLDHQSEPLPAILMVHGWGGIQKGMTKHFYEHFVQLGYAVMTFDYPGWGDSAGLPRNRINPWQRVRDADAALAHLKSSPWVDAGKIVLWGSSFGGGHVVDLAAQHPDLMGAIAQIPVLDGLSAVRAVPTLRLLRFLAYGCADMLVGPVYMPVLAPPGKFATFSSDGGYAALLQSEKEDNHVYDNRVAARSVFNVAFYRPIKRIKDIRVPILLIGAKEDSIAPFSERKIQKISNPNVQTRVLDANHFTPYFKPVVDANLAIQAPFLTHLLKQHNL